MKAFTLRAEFKLEAQYLLFRKKKVMDSSICFGNAII